MIDEKGGRSRCIFCDSIAAAFWYHETRAIIYLYITFCTKFTPLNVLHSSGCTCRTWVGSSTSQVRFCKLKLCMCDREEVKCDSKSLRGRVNIEEMKTDRQTARNRDEQRQMEEDERQSKLMEIKLAYITVDSKHPFFLSFPLQSLSFFPPLSYSLPISIFLSLFFRHSLYLSLTISISPTPWHNSMICPDSQALKWS